VEDLTTDTTPEFGDQRERPPTGDEMAFGKYAVDYEQRIDYGRLRRERLRRAKDQIEKTELGAILSWDAATIRYLTSYYDPTCMRASETQCVFLPRTGDPILFCTDTPSGTERRMQWMKGRVRPSVPSLKLTAKTANDLTALLLVDTFAKLMAEHGVEKQPLGIDGSVFGITISEAFHNAGIPTLNATPVLDEARQIKTQDEIELMRISCANTESAFAAIVDAIRPGIRRSTWSASASKRSTKRESIIRRTWCAAPGTTRTPTDGLSPTSPSGPAT
jgi:Xaa-Pro aminopeptidase